MASQGAGGLPARLRPVRTAHAVWWATEMQDSKFCYADSSIYTRDSQLYYFNEFISTMQEVTIAFSILSV